MKAINAIIALSLKNQNRPLKATGGERDVCPGSSVSTGANFKLQLHFTAAEFPVAAAESPPMTDNRSDGHRLAVNSCTNHGTVCELFQEDKSQCICFPVLSAITRCYFSSSTASPCPSSG